MTTESTRVRVAELDPEGYPTPTVPLFHVIATTANGVKVRYEARPRRCCEEMAERRLIPQSYIDRVDVVACKGDGCYECACLASR